MTLLILKTDMFQQLQLALHFGIFDPIIRDKKLRILLF